uniref:Uncharacterized protein n=1 Tax=Arundo donax TaxID=35708 RepID=A0A0A9AKD6_ARUDO
MNCMASFYYVLLFILGSWNTLACSICMATTSLNS